MKRSLSSTIAGTFCATLLCSSAGAFIQLCWVAGTLQPCCTFHNRVEDSNSCGLWGGHTCKSTITNNGTTVNASQQYADGKMGQGAPQNRGQVCAGIARTCQLIGCEETPFNMACADTFPAGEPCDSDAGGEA